MSRLCRTSVLLLLVLLSWNLAAIPADTAGSSVTLKQGALAITPSFLTVSYTAPPAGTRRVVTSSFSVRVTDARGTATGWDIRASVIATAAPRGGFPIGQQSITGVSVVKWTGTRPNLSAPSDDLLPAPQIIARSAPRSGMGQSTESFSTRLVLASGLPGGRYTATLLLFVTAIGSGWTPPGGRTVDIASGFGVPEPAPPVRTSPGSQGEPGVTPPPPTRLLPVAPSGNTSDPLAKTGQPSPGAPQVGAPPATIPPAASTGNLPASGSATPAAARSTAQPDAAAPPDARRVSSDADNDTAAAAPDTAPLDLPLPDDLTALPQIVVPSTVPPYPIVTLESEALMVTVPFVPALYDPATDRAIWHMQTTLIAGQAGQTALWLMSTTPIRTNLGQYFSTALDLSAGKATIAVYPFERVRDGAQAMGPGTLLTTIGAGP